MGTRTEEPAHAGSNHSRRRGRSPSSGRLRWTALGSVLAVSASLLGGAVFAAPAHAVANTVVSLTFDDANDNQFAAATTMRNANLRGTFFVNSGFLNAPTYMTTAQAQQLQADGHEIGGHSVTHPDLAVTGADEARRQVCNDRVNLTSMGLDIRSFAYPFASSNPAAEAIVRDCGYNSARGLGDIRSKNPESATFPVAERIPPANLFYTGAPDQVDSTWTLADLQNVVTQSVNGGGGWVQLTFHHVGRDGEPLSIPSTVFAQYTNWLRDEVTAGRIEVKPVRDVIGGATKPIVAGPAAPAPITSGNLLQNPGLQTPSSVAGVPRCWAFGGFGVNTPQFSQVAGRTSTIAQQLTMTNYVDGDAKLLPTLDLGECAPGAVPGRAYVIKAWYKSTGPTQFELYYRTGLGTWRYWTSSPLYNAAADWTQLTFTSPPVPEGASAISMGLNLTSNGILVTDDYELTVSGTTPPPTPPPAPAPTPPAAVAAINAAAAASPGVGTASGAVVCGLVSGGCYQNYQNGSIHWTQATGARITRGAIAAAWAGQRWENGPLGYPTSNEVGGLKNGGVYQNFQGGTVHWTPATGARITKGAIGAAWAAQGWENGGLGYPTGNEVTGLKNGGAYQNFQGGVVHWSPATGARITRGAIDAAWASFNWENGFLGYPTSNEIVGLRNGGVYQNFQGGVIYWSPATGARSNAGAIRNAYASQGWENGRLGYPTTNEFRLSATLVAQDFQGGRITWSAATGAAITYR
ncbi:polysaccharide deacetylase family protein [Arthrobacter sp. B0490]|uniref:polysaccharide deacetylase family protein n=1 Tax=Arthrobacter sp. B0490 TaxID=2058891 RepID=UPI000CE4C73B|nr:polysaccharide deacetylase family protein [Arthrobacter sp. B0490]